MIGNKIEPFKIWCQKVLPNVYDDSLSYYEYLCKMNEYLNQVIEQINTLTEAEEEFQEDLSAQWTAYKNGLNTEWNTYKTELTAEWNTYRTQLTQAWTETKNYIDNYFDNLDVQEEINNKLDEMATNGTLSNLIEGVISDDIPSVVTAWLNENVDPIGSAVVVDKTLSIDGAAADAKVTGLVRDDLFTITNNTVYEWENGYVYKTVNNVIDITNKEANASYKCVLIPCNAGDVFTVSGIDVASSGKLYSFIDSSGTVLMSASTNTNASERVITAPTDSAYLVMNSLVSNYAFVAKNILVKNHVGVLVEKYIKGKTFARGTIQSTGYLNPISYRIYLQPITTLVEDIRIVSNTGFKTMIVNYNADYTFNSVGTFSNADKVIPAGTLFRIVIARMTEDTTEVADIDEFLAGISIYINPYATLDDIPDVLVDPLKNKTINVIGDSYVAGSALGVSSTWHYKMALNHNMSYNNYGINGTGLVAYREQFGLPVVARYSSMTDNADIVVVIGGKNDYNAQISIADFETGLETLCSGLVEKYIGKTICFFTPWNVPQSVLADLGNDGNIPLSDYIASIVKICKKYSIAVYNCDESGIYMFSSAFRSAYCQSANDVSHLNNNGSELFLPRGENFIKKLI